jgi:hypothetical protein
VAAAQKHFRQTILKLDKPSSESDRFAEIHPEGVVHAQ